MVMGISEVSVESVRTVHCTRIVEPPPVPELLHWVTVAFVVLAGNGSQTVVGFVPPPVPDSLHWLTVTSVGVTVPVMLLIMCTVQVTVPPSPLSEPSHGVTVVVLRFVSV